MKESDEKMTDFLNSDRFAKIEAIEKGWSGDKKYCVTRTDGEKYLLRISLIEQYEERKSLFDMLEQRWWRWKSLCACR